MGDAMTAHRIIAVQAGDKTRIVVTLICAPCGMMTSVNVSDKKEYEKGNEFLSAHREDFRPPPLPKGGGLAL